MTVPARPPVVGPEEAAGRYVAILRALPDLIFVLDRHDIFIDAYAGDSSALIVAPEVFLGRHVSAVLPDLAGEIVRLCAAARRTGGVQTLEYDIDLGGEPRTFEARLSAFDQDAIAVVSRDITARRKAEADLRRAEAETRRISTFRETILRTAGDGIVVFRRLAEPPFAETTLWNDRMTEITGYTLDEINAVGWHRALFPDPDLRERMVARLRSIDRDQSQQEWAFTHKSGSLRYVSVATSVVEMENGVPAIVAVVHDLTGERRAREEQRRLQDRIERAQKLESLGLLAGGVAHDFNNLLTSMMGYADLVRKSVPEESDIHRMVGEIEQAAECAIALTRQMLAYAGQGQSTIEPVALDDLVRDMTRLLGTAARKDARLVLDLSPAWLLGDASQIRQIVMNLITNASEAIDADGEIRIATGVRHVRREELRSPYLHEELPAGEYAWLEVRDTGCGMDDRTVSRIFDPFFSTKFTGRGLGLAAVLGIVRGHGGTIKVTTAEGHGSRFEVLLPYHAEDVPSAPVPADEPDDVSGEGTVLVIEDDAKVRTFIERALQRAGFQAEVAADGLEGLDRFRQLYPGLVAVIVDYMMPRMKGDEVAAEIRRVDRALPVLMMSGFSEIDVRNRAVASAATEFIQKPFRAGRLTGRLRAAIGVRRTS